MKKTIIYLIAIAIASLSASAQTMRIERTDVDSTRYGHVTANFKFGIDIYIDDLENVNSASFQLQWNFGDYVHYSGYEIGDFGDNGTVYITNPKVVPGTDSKYINVGIFSGTTIGDNEFDNPKLLHLEFAVSNDIPNRETLIFTLVNFFATAFVDSVQTNVAIKNEQLELNIHSFINVWPGDSNNDGLVDTRDYNQIGLYFEGNSIQNDGRSFKRKNASIMWTGQKVLVWDNADATFADCDGDGVITVADGMVVFHNDSKTHNEGTGLLGEIPGVVPSEINQPIRYMRIPIFSPIQSDYRALTAKATIPEGMVIADIVGGDLYKGTKAHVIKQVKGNEVEFTIGSFDNQFNINTPGIIAYILVQDENTKVDKPIVINDVTILNKDNKFQALGTITGIEERNTSETKIEISDSEITIELSEIADEIVIYNISGRKMMSLESASNRYSIANDFQTGNYLMMIKGKKVSIETFQIVK